MRQIKDKKAYSQRALRMASKALLWLSDEAFDSYIRQIQMNRDLMKVYAPAIKKTLESNLSLMRMFE